jgi:hypothetical protein
MEKETKSENVVPVGAKFELNIEGKKAYLKAVPRHVLETAMGLIMPTHGAPKLITAGEVILNACWISGDEEIRTDNDLLVEACLQSVSLIERKEASLKKL